MDYGKKTLPFLSSNKAYLKVLNVASTIGAGYSLSLKQHFV